MDSIRGIFKNLGGNLAEQYRYFLQALREIRAGDDPEQVKDKYTTLRYKLDMDERGVLKSATPSQSQLAVTNQEQSNIRRLTAEAQRRGEEVVEVDVTYTADIVDGKLAIRAGHVEVLSRHSEPAPELARITPESNAAENSTDYEHLRQANREAADSMRHLDLADDGTLRGLSLGLSPEEEPVLDAPEGATPVELESEGIED